MDKGKIRERLKHHFARTPKDVRFDFMVLLEDSEEELVKFGVECEHGNMWGYKKVLNLLEEGYKFIAVQSTHKWDWKARRYVNWREYDRSNVAYEDDYGKYYVEDLWVGYYTKIDVLENSSFETYSSKTALNLSTYKEKVYHISKKFNQKNKLFKDAKWGELTHPKHISQIRD